MTTVYTNCGWCGFGKTKLNLEDVCSKDSVFEDGVCVQKYPDKEYRILGRMSFDDAKTSVHPGCNLLGKEDLVGPNRQTTLDFIKHLNHSSWVDATRSSADTFVWNDSSLMEMGASGNWASGEPNNDGGIEDRVVVRANGLMNDLSGNTEVIAVEVCPVTRP